MSWRKSRLFDYTNRNNRVKGSRTNFTFHQKLMVPIITIVIITEEQTLQSIILKYFNGTIKKLIKNKDYVLICPVF